ncbi:hypothetical protein GEMRC1_013993 [Eukaryota sp. GEM-RC1]
MEELLDNNRFAEIKELKEKLLDSIAIKFQTLAEEAKEAKKQAFQRIQERNFSVFDAVDVSDLNREVQSIKDKFANVMKQFEISIESLKNISSPEAAVMISSAGGSTSLTESTILEDESQLNSILPNVQSARLLFRASRDGFTAKAFHQRCDGHANALVLLKTTNNNIAGGFQPSSFLLCW